MPLMLTGGFRTREGMQTALEEGDCDVIGLGRPLCTEPDLPKRLLSGEADAALRWEHALVLRPRGWLSPTSPLLLARVLNVLGAQAWYYQQVFRLADHGRADTDLGLLTAAGAYLRDELATARRMHRARRAGAR